MRLTRVRLIALAAMLLPIGAFGQQTVITVTPSTGETISVSTTQPAADASTTLPTAAIDTTQPAAAGDTTQPTAVADATQPADTVSADARALLDKVRDAYAKADAVHMIGSFTAKIDIAGQQQNHTATFEATFQSPNKFRQSTTGESPEEALTLGNTGEKLYVFSPTDKQYMTKEAPKPRGSGKDLPFARIMLMQNPAMLLALSGDASQELLDDARVMAMTGSAPQAGASRTIALDADEKVGETSYKSIKITGAGGDVSVLVNPDTHLVRRLTIDLKNELTRQGQAGVKEATLSYDYTTADLNPTTQPDQFAWTPPEGAKDAEKAQADAEVDRDKDAKSLEGTAAPDFKLTGLDGKPISMADLKGSVVILDFWATWCPPCNASLPPLDQTAKDYAEKGVKVYGIDLQESKEDVAAFVKEKGLSIPMLLDSNADVAKLFKVNVIPHTIIIGKDGVVRKVIIGFNESDGEKEIHDALDAALK